MHGRSDDKYLLHSFATYLDETTLHDGPEIELIDREGVEMYHASEMLLTRIYHNLQQIKLATVKLTIGNDIEYGTLEV